VIPSSGIQSKFEQAESDVILLLDCCFSATTPITGFQQNGKVMEVMTACGYETTAAEADQHSFTKALTHVLARASKGPSFTIGELHSRVLSRLKCYAPELEVVDGNYVDTADRGLRLEPLVRRTPFYSTLCKTIPPRSIVLAPLRQPHPTTTLDSGEDTPDHSSTDSSGQCDPSENDQSQNLPRKRRRPLEHKEKFPQIILAVRVTKGGIDHESWLEWIRNAPLEAEDIHVEGKYGSFSTLLLLRMPISIWNLLPDNPAYSFVGFVTSENTASGKIPTCPCINLCNRCIKKIRAAKISSFHQHRDQDTDLLPSQDNRISVNKKRARGEDEPESDADTPRSTGSSVTEVEEQAQHPSPSPNYPDALRSQSDVMDEDIRDEFPSPASQTTTTGMAGSSPVSEEVASSLGALHISQGKGKARDFGKVLRRGTPAPVTPESAPDNDPIAHRTRSAQRRKTYAKSVPSERNDTLPPSRSVKTTLASTSRSSNILKKKKVSPRKTLRRESRSQQFSIPSPNSPGPVHSSSLGGYRKTKEKYHLEWFWFCVGSRSKSWKDKATDTIKCQCGQGPAPADGFSETCVEWNCSHIRCSACKVEQQKVRDSA